MREVRRLRHPAATAHSRQNGLVEWASPCSAEPAWLLGLDSADGLAAQSETGRQERPVPSGSACDGYRHTGADALGQPSDRVVGDAHAAV